MLFRIYKVEDIKDEANAHDKNAIGCKHNGQNFAQSPWIVLVDLVVK